MTYNVFGGTLNLTQSINLARPPTLMTAAVGVFDKRLAVTPSSPIHCLYWNLFQ